MTKKRRPEKFQSESRGLFYWLNPFNVLALFVGPQARRKAGGIAGRLVRGLLAILVFPFRITGQLLVQAWYGLVYSWKSAAWRTFWYGLPFAAVTLGSAFLVLACRAVRPTVLAQEYTTAARNAMYRKNHKAAVLYYERSMQLERVPNNETLFSIAMAAHELGNASRVDAIMRILAPDNDAVYAPAHVWRAKQIASKGSVTSAELQQIHYHLRSAVQLNENDPEARMMLGMYYVQLNRWEQALEHLTVAARHQPEVYLLLAKAHALQGNRELGLFFGEKARDHFRKLAASKPSDIGVRLNWADAVTFLEDFKGAIAILTEGLTIKDELAFRQAMARVYVLWSDSLKGETLGSRVQQLKLLELGIAAYPGEDGLFDRMMAILRRDDEISGTARQFLIERISRGESVMVAHLLLGTDEGERGNYDKAIQHLEQASRLDPSAPVVANNLAWYLLQANTIDVENAYRLVSALSERWPRMGAIHDTRGQILAKMGRWEEALGELEKGLVQTRGNVTTHKTIAECYDHLGMTELAQEHRRIVQKLDAAAAKDSVK